LMTYPAFPFTYLVNLIVEKKYLTQVLN